MTADAQLAELGPALARDACPACASRRSRLAFTDRNRREGLDIEASFLRCLGCGTLYLREIPEVGKLASAYADGIIDVVDAPGELVGAAPTRPNPWLRRLSRAIRGRPHSWPEETGNGRRILDFGCGAGSKLFEFHERGWQVAGVDLNRAAIARAQARQPWGQWFAGNVDSLPDWEPFDVIRADSVVEHLPDPAAILSVLRTRLRAGGRLLVYVPNGESLSVRLLRGGSQACWIPFHLQLFSSLGLETLLHRVGFDSVKISQFTPLSWWEINALQTIAAPGYIKRPPLPRERLAVRTAKLMAPLWLLINNLGLGEELVAETRV